jgi:hypothetical protein
MSSFKFFNAPSNSITEGQERHLGMSKKNTLGFLKYRKVDYFIVSSNSNN